MAGMEGEMSLKKSVETKANINRLRKFLQTLPEGIEKEIALSKLREVSYWANASLTTGERRAWLQ